MPPLRASFLATWDAMHAVVNWQKLRLVQDAVRAEVHALPLIDRLCDVSRRLLALRVSFSGGDLMWWVKVGVELQVESETGLRISKILRGGGGVVGVV